MTTELSAIRQCLREGDLKRLFIEELGWDRFDSHETIQQDGHPVHLHAVAHKRGMVAYVCETSTSEDLPKHPERSKIERQVAKVAHEHIIVFMDQARRSQVWQWVKREPGKPVARREHHFHASQPGESLAQKLQAIKFTLEEEDRLTLPEVTERARSGFDIERVTKRFYDRFKKEHGVFLGFVSGISDRADHEWYASVMLNRLMFVYFVQKKGFLDGDRDYLRGRLLRCQRDRGQDEFYSFYRHFLLRLFHEGLGGRKRTPELDGLLGRIPYLNGGLFERHQIEKDYPDIGIPDAAFKRVFDYFDEYQWHLDERPLKADNEINPDVLGYIFEKYINQKQMGAYYTKEDITEYISKSTVIPYIIEAARDECGEAFDKACGPTVWDLLAADPDRYIYPAVLHGTELPLPNEIAIGVAPPTLHQPVGEGPVKTLEVRRHWNKPAPPEFALPTETWREVVARRERCEEVRAKLADGDVDNIGDLVSLNLDVRQFVQDSIQQCESPDLLRAFWHGIEKMTILDPTCGSGAFLFAALNILEPLYEGCLDRMEAFIGDLSVAEEKGSVDLCDFALILDNVAQHPNRRYFVFKSIILNNLFGVDIMEEAVEICKLRLFLKLAAQVEPDSRQENFGVEPLPDIDFNIKAGNTLVGFATYAEVERATRRTFDFGNAMERIAAKASELETVFDSFRRSQVTGIHVDQLRQKQVLRHRLRELNEELNCYLAGEYGVSTSKEEAFLGWLRSHQPFHWFVEFYGIMSKGGFDVIIGNPPYVEYKDVRSEYRVLHFQTEGCSNLFAFVLERCTTLGRLGTSIGMIVPLSAISTDRMTLLIEHLKSNSGRLHVANFSWRPGKLFDGVNLQLSIVIQRLATKPGAIETTRYLMWDSVARPNLFARIEYIASTDKRLSGSIPKVGAGEAASTLTKVRQQKRELGGCFARRSNNRVFYRRGGLYWKVFVDFQTASSEEKVIHILPRVDKYAIIAALSSNLWWWYFTITSDCRHLGNRDIGTFPFDPRYMDDEALGTLCRLGKAYVRDLALNAEEQVRIYKKTNAVKCLSFRVRKSKPIIDRIDTMLARHFGLTEGELDFIVNYDIKYRLGREEDDAGG